VNKLLKFLIVAIEVPALVPAYAFTACSSEFPDQSSIVAAPVDTTALPTLVSAYLVAKGGESAMVTGGTLQFTVYGIYSDGSVGALPDSQGNAVTLWNTSDHAVARISTMGHATAVGVGIVDIEAVIGALRASPWTVTVTPAIDPAPLTLSCSASPPAIYQGGVATITAAGTTTQHSPLTYGYSASAGSISGTDQSETLETAGAPAGLINVTCSVEQDGATASATTNVILWPQALGGEITVTSPLTGSTVSFPPWIQAQNTGCNGLAPVYFGYSIDHGNVFTSGVTASEIDTPDPTIGPGIHTIYFKSWTSNGECPVLYSTFAVTGSAGVGDTIPPNAVSSGDLDGASEWKWNHDPGTPGASFGSSLYPISDLTLDNDAREFYVTYSDNAGELYHLYFGTDTNSTHFVYDTYVYLVDPSQIQNIEMDLNQVMPNGQTVILGAQCTSNSGTWEYTTVSGGAHWNRSNIPCNPQAWTANTWHHVQIASHRDSTGVATYDWVSLDGVLSNFQGASGASAVSLGWPPGDLLLNFQLDGAGSGSMTVDIDQLTVYRW
jgi:hypothetical protein